MPHPEQTTRLFPLHGPSALPEPGEPVSDFVIGRILEEGEEVDLQWLTRRVAEERLVDWLRQRGERQLSRRSYLFWSCVLGLAEPSGDDSGQHSIRNDLWPL